MTSSFFHLQRNFMQHNSQKTGQFYYNIALLLLMPILFGLPTRSHPDVACSGPQVSVSSQSSGAVSFSWSAVSGATEYVVFYVRQSDQYTSPQTQTQSTSISYSGLASGHYHFYFATVCGGDLSEIIIIEDLII